MADYDEDEAQKPLVRRMVEKSDPKKRDAFQKSFNKATGSDDEAKSPSIIDAFKRRLGIG